MSRGLAAAALFVSAWAGCAAIVVGDDPKSPISAVCGCYQKVPGAEGFVDDCEREAFPAFENADPEDRAAYLAYFAGRGCGEGRRCTDVVKECLDHDAVCTAQGDGCSSSAICCGRSVGAGCCMGDEGPTCCGACLTCAHVAKEARASLKAIGSDGGCEAAKQEAAKVVPNDEGVCVESIAAVERLRACIAQIVKADAGCGSDCDCASPEFAADRCAACVERECQPVACKDELP